MFRTNRPTERQRQPQPQPQLPPLSLNDFRNLTRSITWTTSADLPENIVIDDIPLPESQYRDAFVSPFNPPVHDIILYLPSTRYEEYPPDRMVYHSDPGFTPLDIFGAIHTYYMMDLPNTVLERMIQDSVANAAEALRIAQSRRQTEGRISIMGDLTNFDGLTQVRDGYHVDLGS
jgi:hypothetical protein